MTLSHYKMNQEVMRFGEKTGCISAHPESPVEQLKPDSQTSPQINYFTLLTLE